jgi:hypothetical protein
MIYGVLLDYHILLGWNQCNGSNYEYSSCNFLWRLDKALRADESDGLTDTCASNLYDIPMVCKRLHGESRILKNSRKNTDTMITVHPTYPFLFEGLPAFVSQRSKG